MDLGNPQRLSETWYLRNILENHCINMKKYHFQETTTESEIKDKGLNVFKEALVIKSLK